MVTVVQVVLALVIMFGASISIVCVAFVVMAAFEGLRSPYRKAAPSFPRTMVLVPAHNEAAVIERTVDAMMHQEYPPESLHVMVIDDASTDGTGAAVEEVARRNPGRVHYLRRPEGGQGKAAVLNAGLGVVLGSEWTEAVLIIDADVIFEPRAVRSMTRHLADPDVGAVGGYVREGSRPGSSVARFIGFEYVLAQALARRAQNVTGVFACVPGGAQLHSRANIEAIGGRIDDTTKAEDTVSTLLTQLRGRKVVFDGRAICWAEEPDRVDGLWKQRLRWFRGNLQIVGKYKNLWFRRTTPVGRWRFGISWFAIMLQPLFMLLSTAALVALYFTDYGLAGTMLRTFWITNALCWVVLGAFGLTVDRTMARQCWFQCVTFTGVVSAVIILYALIPSATLRGTNDVLGAFGDHLSAPSLHWEVLFAGIWGSACMLLGFVTHWVDAPRGPRHWLSTVLLYLGGYGPLVCAVGLNAYIDHVRGVDRRWEVTVKTGRSTGGRRDGTPGRLDGTGARRDGRALGPVPTGAD